MKDYKKLYEDYFHYNYQIEKLQQQLSNTGFIQKAKPEAIAASEKKLKDFSEKIEQIYNSAYFLLLNWFSDKIWIEYYIQHERHIEINDDQYSESYFEYVYKPITNSEVVNLLRIYF